jgi:hypothetical protein
MSLNTAHEGYEYQDLLTAYFILYWILEDVNSTFVIDKKEYDSDRFDDLTIKNEFGVFKKQIKYSNASNNRTLVKTDLSSESSYKLAIDELFNSWYSHRDKDSLEIRLCLAWNEPNDNLLNVIELSSKQKSFKNHDTNLYKINGQKLWPKNSEPLSNWRRLRTKSSDISRDDFLIFCENLTIETNFPKSSIDIYSPDKLEKIVLDQVDRLGIGTFPNNHIKKEEFILSLSSLIRKARSKGSHINTEDIFSHFQIKTNFGSIEQNFPIDEAKNVALSKNLSTILGKLNQTRKVILTGEPGSGKSWFINNLIKKLDNRKIQSIKHYCYTDIQDKHQKERIQKDVFYGNLIADIIKTYPDLKEKKHKRYASSLSELNLLIEHISEPTVLIVDGLDHINRVFNYRPYHDISLSDIEIINEITKIKCSENLSILVASQPISELDKIDGFQKSSIPQWTNDDVIELMDKMYLNNIQVDNNSLSELLVNKSQGNPLYLTYLIEELKSLPDINMETLDNLPPYSYNLKEYYTYLLSKLNIGENVPLVLSAVSFSLTKKELKEITGLGTYVDDSLSLLKPVLRQNQSSKGYIIYHESFRRFIIEHLKTREIVEGRIFRPVIDWFEQLDFYLYPKAYRFYLQVLVDGCYFSKALKFISKEFLKKCLYAGHPWEIIEHNYNLLVKVGTESKDVKKIILLNEINKTLSGTKDAYDEAFLHYIECLGHLIGFDQASEFLLFEGKPTLPLIQGLKVCYLVDSKNKVAPWNYYSDYFKEGDSIQFEDFHLYIRLLIANSNKEKLSEIGFKVIDRKLPEFSNILKNELKQSHNQDFIDELLIESKALNSILFDDKSTEDIDYKDLGTLASEIIEYDNVFDSEVSQIEEFFYQIELQIRNAEKIDNIIRLFSAKNWFYNWLIFYIKVIRLDNIDNSKSADVRAAFDYLAYNTKPFHGKPRTCDLYSLNEFIYQSLNKGLSLVKNLEDWKHVLNVLNKTSIETTTYLQNSPGGPIATDKFFKLCIEFINPTNVITISEVLEKSYERYKNGQFHAYLSEYCFQLVKIYSFLQNNDKVDFYFKQGVDYILGYTWRRDLTLEDLTESIESLYHIDNELGNEYILKLKNLVDSVVEHTDGKDTKHFPVEWFERFYNINPKRASLFLLNELTETRYDWRQESSFRYLLNQSQGKTNALVECFLHQTLVVESDEKFIMTSLDLIDKIDIDSAKTSLIGSLSPKIHIRQNSERSLEFQNELSKRPDMLGLSKRFFSSYKSRNSKRTPDIDPIVKLKRECISRKEFSDMSPYELSNYLKDNPLTKKDLQSLIYKFDSFKELTPEFKEIIQYLVGKNERYHDEKNLDINPLFDSNSEASVYFWVSRFIYQRDGWFKSLSNIEAFEKAHSLHAEKSLEYLFELIPNKLDLGWNRVLSANLFNALSRTKFDSLILKETWLELYHIIESRLPSTEEYNWTDVLTDNYEMNMQEIYVCLLLSRFKSYTVQKYHIVLSGIAAILYSDPKLLIKPLKWFFSKKDIFKKSVILGILELIVLYDEENPNYTQNFEKELTELYPLDYFLIDYLIEYSFNLPQRKKLLKTDEIHYPIQADELDYFKQINYRHSVLERAGIDIGYLFGKYKATYFRKYNDYLELYGNRMYKRVVGNIYYSDYILTLINEEFYNKLKNYGDTYNVYQDLKIDVRTLVAQYLSLSPRPHDLVNSEESNLSNYLCNIQSEGDWIRLGHFEYELIKHEHYELKESKTFGGIVFSTNSEFSFAEYRLVMDNVWEDIVIPYEIENAIVFSTIQKYHQIEDYKILWLNPVIVKMLGLEICHFNSGLKAKNERGDVVLKYNSWLHDYIATDYSHGVIDEIPQKDGAELLIRADYFKKICEMYEVEPKYCINKISQP